MFKLQPVALASSLLLSAAIAAPSPEDLFERAVGDACSATHGKGTCQSTSNCKGISYPEPFCPNDPDDIQCCVEIECKVGSASGFCRSVSNNGCDGGHFDPGNYCPGNQDIQCCLKDGGGDPDPPGDTVGQQVLAKAKEAAGTPYAWGGGSCDGPSADNPPYQYGDVGYDCSGLVCWALCQITGRDLFTEGLRQTTSMYCADSAALGYQKYPFAERKAGDAVFFGGACSCDDDSIHHVGLVMTDGGDSMWNAPNDDINEVLELSISGFGEEPCPNVIRFT